MKALVELICKVGIFMIAAQAVVHFAPAQKYAKYIKLVVGIMILLQFLTPIHKITDGMEEDWDLQFSKMKAEWDLNLTAEGMEGTGSVTESILNNLEMEIKAKLNNELDDEGYSVIKVSVDIDEVEEGKMSYNNKDNSSYKKYKLDMVRVVVRAYENCSSTKTGEDADNEELVDDLYSTYGNNEVRVEKISVEKIGIGEESTKEQEKNPIDSDGKQKLNERLKEEFCNVLGIEEKNMEVIIYGEPE